jgi:hypothetical protein
MAELPRLKRALGLPLLTFSGLGTIDGGGFYVLVGKVAGEAGMLTPAARKVAMKRKNGQAAFPDRRRRRPAP